MCEVHFYNETIKFFRESFKITLLPILNKIKVNRLMKKCDLCQKPSKIHYRVKSIIHKNWIFCCKECWNIISKHDNYSYGGTRKSK